MLSPAPSPAGRDCDDKFAYHPYPPPGLALRPILCRASINRSSSCSHPTSDAHAEHGHHVLLQLVMHCP